MKNLKKELLEKLEECVEDLEDDIYDLERNLEELEGKIEDIKLKIKENNIKSSEIKNHIKYVDVASESDLNQMMNIQTVIKDTSHNTIRDILNKLNKEYKGV